MANGTGAFAGKKRLAFLTNAGTLVQPITKAQFNAWETGRTPRYPFPRLSFPTAIKSSNGKPPCRRACCN